ncbi:MAG: protein kinase [Polyangiales bacterium]
MAMPGSPLPEGFVLGAMSHADRIGLVYDAVSPDGASVSAQVLHPLHVDELRDWFEANALMGLGLRHPNLVRVFAVGETHNGLPVMITERIEGRTLRARVAAGDLLVGHDLARVVRSVADALDFLHAQRVPVLHRALSPENVICTTDGAVKLLAVGQADCPRYAPTKPPYLSPEELCGAATSPASDVFSLASLTFELLTGRPAFAGSADGIVRSVQRGALPFVGVVHSDALAPINRALHRAWTASPRDRTPRAGVFAAELDDALRMVPASLLAVRHGYREGGPRSSVPAPRSLRASQPPVDPRRQPSMPAPPRSAARPMAMAARNLTPFPSSVPVHRGNSAVYALPPPPRLPTALEAPPSEGVFDLLPRNATPMPREAPALAPPLEAAPPPAEPREAPRTRVDTDDAVLILEPSLVDASDLPPPDDELPPLESVAPRDDDDAPEVTLLDEPDARVQRTTVINPSHAPRPVAEPPALAVTTATISGALLAPRPPVTATPSVRESRPSWQRWRPTVPTRPSNRPWHARELRFTPRLLALIVGANLALTALLVWAVVYFTRR